MRKLILSLFGLVMACGVAFAAYDEGAAIHNRESSKGSAADPVRVYQLVRYGEVGVNVPSISAGEVVYWDVVSDDGVTINRLAYLGTATGAASTDSVAGIAVGAIPTSDNASSAANSIGSRNWGYVQTYGPCSTAMVKASVTAGQALAASDTLIEGAYVIGVTSANGANKAGSIFAFALDTVSATSNSNEIFVKNR